MRAEYYLELKEYNKALDVYDFLKTYCKIAGCLNEEMLMAEQLGHMHSVLKDHEKAANYFRNMLKLAWVLDDAYMELKSYNHLSNEHFHMGNLEKCKYYSVRYSGGLLESDQSRMKESMTQSYKGYKNKAKAKGAKLDKIDTSKMDMNDETEILPSPSNER